MLQREMEPDKADEECWGLWLQYQIGAIHVSFIKMIFEEILERDKRVYQTNICRSVLEA